jgi:hypothetical protein
MCSEYGSHLRNLTWMFRNVFDDNEPTAALALTACDVVDRAGICSTQLMLPAEHISDSNFAAAWAVRRKNVGEPVSLNRRRHQTGPGIGTVAGSIRTLAVHEQAYAA